MLSILVQSILIASSGLFSVGSITIVTLLLTSDHGLSKGLGYISGYILAYSLIGISIVVLNYQSSDNADGTSIIFPVTKIIFGLLLLSLGIKNWRKSVTEKKEEGGFIKTISNITPVKSFGLGALVTVINVKNLGLFLSAVSVVVLSDMRLGDKILLTLLVVLVFCLSIIIPIIIYISLPSRRDIMLAGIINFIEKHSHAISKWIPVIFGLIFITKGVIEIN